MVTPNLCSIIRRLCLALQAGQLWKILFNESRKTMSLKDAKAKYDALLYRQPTDEEMEVGLAEMIKLKGNGRVSDTYNPAYDPTQPGDPWP